MTVYNWRRKAKDLLYFYPETKKLLAEGEYDIITRFGRHTDRRYEKGGISDPTAMKMLLMEEDASLKELRKEAEAVERLLRVLDTGRRPDRMKMKLVQHVYLKRDMTLLRYSMEVSVSDRTVKRWNDQLLRILAVYMGWLDVKEIYK